MVALVMEQTILTEKQRGCLTSLLTAEWKEVQANQKSWQFFLVSVFHEGEVDIF